MKTKNIYTARIAADEELLDVLGPDRAGCMESWLLETQGASFSIYLFVPDLRKTDTFDFDVLFDERFREFNNVKPGDRFPVSIPFPKTLRQIEITGVTEGEPINNLENKRPVKQSLKTVKGHLEYLLYHDPDEFCGEDGWFDVEVVIKSLERIWCLADIKTLEQIADKDGDQRYILSDDRTKIRISPEHPAPKYVEDELKDIGSLEVKRSAFIKNNMPFVKDKKRSVVVDLSTGGHFEFPYCTNKIFQMDGKHFFMLIEHEGGLFFAVSPYMTKDNSRLVRWYVKELPALINHFYMPDAKQDGCDLTDYEGVAYKITVAGTT